MAKALTIRQTEERLLTLYDEGQLFGTLHTCIGQEWGAVAVTEALRPGDYIFSNHRNHGHYLAWTDDVEGLIAELMGRSTGPCGGRGGSQHLCRDRFFSNGIQGGLVPTAAGTALAEQLTEGTGIAVAFIGDGTLGQGVIYETLNIASKWSLPLLIVLEDNGIAQSTYQVDTLAGTIRGRAHALGINIRQADTWHPTELIAQAAEAVKFVRVSNRPMLLHIKTYHLRAHSKDEDKRDHLEVASYDERDTLSRFVQENSPAAQKLLAAIEERLDKGIEQALASEHTSVECEVGKVGTDIECPVQWKPIGFESKRVDDAIRDALSEALSRDERIVLLGEDIRDPYGGVFKVTRGLSEKFDDRVCNTPVSEAAIVGIGNGLALAGKRPVVEIMFGDFMLLAADQIINHAAKFAWMYNEQVKVPIVIRTPMGGYRGYGPSHSQTLEKHFLGVPGIRILAIHKRYCPERLYRTLFANNNCPTLVIENKLLYDRQTDPTVPEDYELLATDTMFPTVRLTPYKDPQLTIVAYGGMVEAAESAMIKLGNERDLACELLIPIQLYPLDMGPIVESVGRTGRLLVVEEGQGFAGFGSEVIAQLASDCGLSSFKARRIHARNCPIPASQSAEQTVLPSIDDIFDALTNLVDKK
ncbi:MAG: pyruvate dehydrogenase [Planctomycetota bacterium]|nr:MAG: pyruvate dehydrogenase [Planctomycetota bacterium]